MKKNFKNKLFVLFISIFLIGFFIGYDYSLLQAQKIDTAEVAASQEDVSKEWDNNRGRN
jgi:hypothetical protein